MPVTPTYPGVYIEEIPSGVRTITGVATSTAAFVDYFKRGVADKATRIFSFADFEREFGGLDAKSEASYAIQQFFLNGGTEAWVVRSTGDGAAASQVTLLDGIGGSSSLVLEAGRGTRSNPGSWGNQLRVQVEPLADDRFSLTVLLVESRNGREVVAESETFPNLSMTDGDPRNARTVINDNAAGSKLVHVMGKLGASRPLATGTVSGGLAGFSALSAASPQVNVSIGAERTVTARFSATPKSLHDARRLLESAIRQARPELKAFSEATVSIVKDRLRILAGPTSAESRITFSPGGTDPTASNLGLVQGEQHEGLMSADLDGTDLSLLTGDLVLTITIGSVGPVDVTLDGDSMHTLDSTGALDNARTELETKLRAADPADEFAQARVVRRTVGSEEYLIVLAGIANAPVTVATDDSGLLDPTESTAVMALVSAEPADPIAVVQNAPVGVKIGADGPYTVEFTVAANSLASVADQLQAGIRAANPASPAFTGALVAVHGSGAQARLVALTGVTGNAVTFTAAPADATTVTELKLDSASVTSNVQYYAVGKGPIASSAQGAGQPGTDAVPDANALIGDLNTKTGLYALEDADLFNLLCLPYAATLAAKEETAGAARSLLAAAVAYCEKRRAFLLLDTPPDHDDPEDITRWLEANAELRHRNVAIFYPRLQIPDPLDKFRLHSFGASGTVAGLFARIDSTRGVWKAPAGTEAVVRNVSELEDILTDMENGVLNPLAINCLRNFPVYGNVVWGARTLEGSDQAASDWKYIPVRRLALYLEESLYRGTKWVVFEPNDEPLWSQIRLNISAFMHDLFRQGAFQGTTPRDAYFVKCDKETTTQNDINKGIVNILVGFAPLKPAEFVMIKIQQIAGRIQT